MNYTREELQAEWDRRDEKYRAERLKTVSLYKLPDGTITTDYAEAFKPTAFDRYWFPATIVICLTLAYFIVSVLGVSR